MTLIKSYSPNNQALIVCPIFNAETKIADCFALEQQLARGKISSERKGCQACLRSSKCPIYWINRDIQRGGEDAYHASEPKTVALKPLVLDQIRAILVRDDAMNTFQVDGEERNAITAANEAAASGASARSSRKAPPVKLAAMATAQPKTPAAKPAADDELLQAAISGDMSAAVTRAVAKASETPAAKPVEKLAEKPAEPVRVETPAPAPKPAPTPQVTKPAAPVAAASPAPAGRKLSLLEMARARQAAAQKDAA